MAVRRFAKVAAAALIAAGSATLPSVARTAADVPTTDPDEARASQFIRVGMNRSIRTIAEAARLATTGAIVEVDAGTYRGDVAVWTQDNLTLRAVGGRVRLIAAGAAAEGKAIWVVRAARVSIEGFDFEGARVPGLNGAGIRFERGSLHVRDCIFRDNQSGILAGNDSEAVLGVEDSEFDSMHPEDGENHHLYAGTINRLSVTGSYFHRGAVGHLLKSRAALNLIRYNRLTDEDGSASYELEFPNGGVAFVVGNIVQQIASTENPHLISFGAEGYRGSANELYLAHNTLIDDRVDPGVFLRIRPGAGTVRVVNNLLVRPARWDLPDAAELRNNFMLKADELDRSAAGAFRLKPGSPAWGKAVPAGGTYGELLTPSREYRHPRHTIALMGPPTHPGAAQAATPVAP